MFVLFVFTMCALPTQTKLHMIINLCFLPEHKIIDKSSFASYGVNKQLTLCTVITMKARDTLWSKKSATTTKEKKRKNTAIKTSTAKRNRKKKKQKQRKEDKKSIGSNNSYSSRLQDLNYLQSFSTKNRLLQNMWPSLYQV